jgi:hypothetical protein
MSYQRFVLPKSVATLASVAGVRADLDFQGSPRARDYAPTLKTKLVSYNQAISTTAVQAKKSDFACTPATLQLLRLTPTAPRLPISKNAARTTSLACAMIKLAGPLKCFSANGEP